MFKKIIFTGFAPNITNKDVQIALGFLLLPWQWKNLRDGIYTKQAEKLLAEYLEVEQSFMFDSGRSALFYALKALGVGAGDKVFVQAYTCVVVINAIKQVGAQPVYVDITDDFNMNFEILHEQAKKNKGKALIIQHTFGVPANLDKLLSVARKFNLKTIEDCAHSLGASYKNSLTGTRGDIGMFSFGSDKIISCVRGGALIARDKKIVSKIYQLQQQLRQSSIKRTCQHLMQVPVFALGKLLYGIFLGKSLLYIAKKINLINKIVYPVEKCGYILQGYPTVLANSLAKILCQQIKQINQLNKHRQNIARVYFKNINNKLITLPINNQEAIYLRYNILVENSNKLHNKMKRKGVILGNWYNNIISPRDINIEITGYKRGMCLRAEFLAKCSVNLPTNRNITKSDAEYIIKLLNLYED